MKSYFIDWDPHWSMIEFQVTLHYRPISLNCPSTAEVVKVYEPALRDGVMPMRGLRVAADHSAIRVDVERRSRGGGVGVRGESRTRSHPDEREIRSSTAGAGLRGLSASGRAARIARSVPHA